MSPRPERPSCASMHGQYVGGLLHQPPRGSSLTPPVQAGAADPLVDPRETALLEGSFHSWVTQSGSRHPVNTGAEARGMDAPHRGGGADLEEIWESPGRLVCVSRDLTMSPLVLSDLSSSTGAGCHGTDVAEASSVCLPPDRSAPGSSGESLPGRGATTASSPILAGPSMVCGPGRPPRRLSVGDSHTARSPLSGRGHYMSPSPRYVEAVGVAPEGAHLIASGLSTKVVETILQSRAPATRKSYAAKWQLFTSWCNSHQLNPVECSIGSVLEFLQDRFASGLSASTLNVYMAAISAHHSPVGEQSLGKHPLAVRFLRGIRRLKPPVCPRMPTWDLAMVLEALSKAPFEPLEAVSPRFTVKTVFLLAISSLKRVGNLRALSVAPSCLEFASGMSRVFLYPRHPQGALGSSTASYSTGILSTSL